MPSASSSRRRPCTSSAGRASRRSLGAGGQRGFPAGFPAGEIAANPDAPRRPSPYARDVRRLSVIQALALAAAVTGAVVLAGGSLVSLLEPERFETVGEGLWWAMTTITTVGYGDVVPSTGAGRIVGVAVMLTGFACLAFVTATVASMIVREVRAEERLIEREESEVLALLAEMNARLERLERREGASPSDDRQRAARAGRR